jgi:hypothetical protein
MKNVVARGRWLDEPDRGIFVRTTIGAPGGLDSPILARAD